MIVKVKLISSYAMLLAMVLETFYICVIGFLYQHQFEEFNKMVWDFPWYLLPLKLQKEYFVMMMNANQSSELKLFYIGPLNLETFVNVRNF
jgi:hypothetical protein